MTAIKIKAYIAPGEAIRGQKLALAINEDPRFEPMLIDSEIPLDVQFRISEEHINPLEIPSTDYVGFHVSGRKHKTERVFNTEFKEPADYVSSALGKDGHLFMQLLAAREAGYPCMVVVLGGDNQVTDAILDALQTRYKGKELGFNIASYESRLIDFEANCEAIGCPVRRWQVPPWQRLLSTAHKILTGGDLLGYRPRPAGNEREIVAASCLFKGIGPELMRNVMAEYRLGFVPRRTDAKPLSEIAGIGKKRAAQLAPLVRMEVAS